MDFINNLKTIVKIHFKFRRLAYRFTGNYPKKKDLDFLFQVERVFGFQLKYAKQIVDMDQRARKRIQAVSTFKKSEERLFPDFNETAIELMLTFAYQLFYFIERDDDLKKRNIEWMISYWMVFKAKELIPSKLEEKLGNLPKKYKDSTLKNKPLDDIQYYIMNLFTERRKNFYSTFENLTDQTINDLTLQTFVIPLIEDKNYIHNSEAPKMLTEFLKASIINFSKVYDLIKDQSN